MVAASVVVAAVAVVVGSGVHKHPARLAGRAAGFERHDSTNPVPSTREVDALLA